MNNKKSNTTSYLLQNILLGILFLGSGLVFDPSSRDPYLGPRMLLFPIIAGVLWFVMRPSSQKLTLHQVSSKSFILTFLAFLLWMGCSTFFAINKSESVFYLQRFVFYFSLLIFWFFILQTNLQKSFGFISRLCTLLVLLLSLVGIGQAAGFAFTAIPGLPHPVGISGNRNVFGAYIALQLPFAAYLLLSEKKSWQWISGLALVFGTLTLLLSQTRSAWLGAGFGFMVANLLFFLNRTQIEQTARQKLRYINIGILGLLVVGVLTVFLILPETSMVQEFKNRVLSLVQPKSEAANIATGNIQERLYVWSQTVEMSKDYPLTGVGAGNWRIAFPEYGGGSSQLSDAAFMDKIRVRPHNFFLRTLSELGWPGLLIFLGLLFLLIRLGWSAIRRSTHPPQSLIGIVSFTALSVFLFDLLFSFSIERIETSNLVFFYLASLLVLNESSPQNKNKAWGFSGKTLSLILVPIFLLTAFYGYKRWQYDRNLLKIVQFDLQERPYDMLSVVGKTENPFITIDPVSDPIQMQKARAFIKLKEYPKALNALKKAESYHPNNHRIHNTKAYVYLQTGDLENADNSLQKAQALSPNYPPMLQNLCLYYFLSRQYLKSMDVMNRLEWKGNPALEKLRTDIQHKIDFGETEDSEIYQAILDIQGQLDSGEKRLNITRLISVYNKMESDSLFIDTYLETIYNGIVYANKKRGMEDRLEGVTARKDKMKRILLNVPNLTEISQRITQNNHFQTGTAMQFTPLQDIRSVNQVLFQIE